MKKKVIFTGKLCRKSFEIDECISKVKIEKNKFYIENNWVSKTNFNRRFCKRTRTLLPNFQKNWIKENEGH